MASAMAWNRSVFSIGPVKSLRAGPARGDWHRRRGVPSCRPANDKAVVRVRDRERPILAGEHGVQQPAARLVGVGLIFRARHREPAAFVIRRDDDQRVRRALGKCQGDLHGAVQLEHALQRQRRIVAVRHAVDRRFLDHQEESVRVPGEDLDCRGRQISQSDGWIVDGAEPFRGLHEELLGGKQPKQRTRRFLPAAIETRCATRRRRSRIRTRAAAPARRDRHLTRFRARARRAVRAGRQRCAVREPVRRAATQDDIDPSAFDVLARDLALVGAVRYVGGKGGRRRVGNLAGADQPDRSPRRLGELEDGRSLLPVGIDRDRAVERLHSGGDRGGRRGRVGDERGRVGGHRAHLAEVREAVHRQPAVATSGQQLSGEAMRLAHAVADQEDDVASDGTISDSGERRTGHGCLSRLR